MKSNIKYIRNWKKKQILTLFSKSFQEKYCIHIIKSGFFKNLSIKIKKNIEKNHNKNINEK